MFAKDPTMEKLSSLRSLPHEGNEQEKPHEGIFEVDPDEKIVHKRIINWIEKGSNMTKFTYNGIDYDTKAPHGSPFDRGAADSYYWRPVKPHYYIYTPGEPSTRYEIDKMTPEQVQEYYAGYEYNEMLGDYKDYDYA